MFIVIVCLNVLSAFEKISVDLGPLRDEVWFLVCFADLVSQTKLSQEPNSISLWRAKVLTSERRAPHERKVTQHGPPKEILVKATEMMPPSTFLCHLFPLPYPLLFSLLHLILRLK